MHRFLPLQADTPYRTRDGRRVVLSPYNSWGLIDPTTSVVYLPHDGNITNGESLEDIVAFHLEPGVWLTRDECEVLITSHVECKYPWQGVLLHNEAEVQYTADGAYLISSSHPFDICEYVCGEYEVPKGALHSGYWRREDGLVVRIYYSPYHNCFVDAQCPQYPRCPPYKYSAAFNGRLSADARHTVDLVAPATLEDYTSYLAPKTAEDFLAEGLLKHPDCTITPIPDGWQAFMKEWVQTQQFMTNTHHAARTPMWDDITTFTQPPYELWQYLADADVAAKVRSNIYQQVPDGFPTRFGTGVHISTQDANLLAYYPTKEHWDRQRPQQIKPGRYLKKYFTDMSDDDIRRHAGAISAGELRFYSDWRDMFKAYRELETSGIVSSCMSKDSFGFMHPLMVYDRSDVELAVLYINSEPVARALYNKRNKHFPMIYGQWERMLPQLTIAGFVHAPLCGANIRRLPRYVSARRLEENGITRDNLDLDTVEEYNTDSGALLMPYIDHERALDRSCNCSTCVDVREDYVTITARGEYEASDNACALIQICDDGGCECEHCGSSVYASDILYVDVDDIMVCEYCYNNSCVEVHGSRSSRMALESTAENRNFLFVDYRWYESQEAAYDAGYRYSDYDDKWYCEEECVFVEELDDYVHTSGIGNIIVWDEVEEEYVTTETYNRREADRQLDEQTA